MFTLMAEDQNDLIAHEHVRVHPWDKGELTDVIIGHDLTEEDIDEILNGHAQLMGRQEEEPNYENLFDRYSISGSEIYGKKMDTFHKDIQRMTPDGPEDYEAERPVQLNSWSKTEETRSEEFQRERHHYVGYIPDIDGEESLVFHYEWTELVKPEQE